MIRIAQLHDAQAILAIYAPYIRDTSITFETEIPSLREFEQRIDSYLQHFPWLVFEQDGIIAGYAYASRYRERIAYQWGLECSVYIDPRFRRQHIASKLYTALFRLLTMQGFRTVYAVINLPNPESVALHESLGFQYFATYENVGYKLGRWKNVGWWQLQLNDFTPDPAPPLPFRALTAEQVAQLLKD